MYKKFMLSLLLLSSFSYNEVLCSSTPQDEKAKEPLTYSNQEIVNGIIIGGAIAVMNTLSNGIYHAVAGWCFPEKDIRDRSDYLDAKFNLKECLKKTKKDSLRNSHGVPVDCEEKLKDFVICGGLNEAMQMVSNFGQSK